MTTPIVFAKPALMQWDGNAVSDHNRKPLSINPERFETAKRMANGTLRKYITAEKNKFSVSWSELPHSSAYTVDGFWGGQEIENFYRNVPGSFLLKLTNGEGGEQSFLVMITNFSKEVSKRGFYDFWDVQIEMEEV